MRARSSLLIPALVAALIATLVPATRASAQSSPRGLGRQLPDWAANSWVIRRHAGPPWALVGGNVIDVETGAVTENATIVIQGDVIRSVGAGPPPPSTATIDISGRWVVPGYFDLHAHVIPESPFFPTAKSPEETLELLLDNGVTTIRLLPLYSESASEWAGRVNHGSLRGPTIVPASGIFEREAQRTFKGFGDAETARSWVRKEALLGARWIKVYNKMDAESLRAIVDEATRHGMRVCGHAQQVPPHEASAIGQATIEHMTGIPLSCLPDDVDIDTRWGVLRIVGAGWELMEPARADTLLETFIANDTGWVPTLVVTEAIITGGGHDGRPFPDEMTAELFGNALGKSARLAVAFHRRGGMLGLGTDFPVNGVPAGTSVHREMQLLVTEGGATPLEALQIATIGSARILGFDGLLGRIAPGSIANLVVLDANPLEDIANTQRIETVIHAGVRSTPR